MPEAGSARPGKQPCQLAKPPERPRGIATGLATADDSGLYFAICNHRSAPPICPLQAEILGTFAKLDLLAHCLLKARLAMQSIAASSYSRRKHLEILPQWQG